MKKILISLIKFYQMMPLKSHYYCRFYPTCSSYAITAIERFGAFKGSFIALKRIIRCHPFGKYGYDPVLERKD